MTHLSANLGYFDGVNGNEAAVRTQMPAQVAHAFEFIRFMESRKKFAVVVTPNMDEPCIIEPADLGKAEQAAYDAALNLMTLYFHGEICCGELKGQDAAITRQPV